MSGTRLGLIFETVALICFGLLSGILLSWQLTLIALSPLLLLIPAMYMSVRVEMWLNRLCDHARGQANMVRSINCLFDIMNIVRLFFWYYPNRLQ